MLDNTTAIPIQEDRDVSFLPRKCSRFGVIGTIYFGCGSSSILYQDRLVSDLDSEVERIADFHKHQHRSIQPPIYCLAIIHHGRNKAFTVTAFSDRNEASPIL